MEQTNGRTTNQYPSQITPFSTGFPTPRGIRCARVTSAKSRQTTNLVHHDIHTPGQQKKCHNVSTARQGKPRNCLDDGKIKVKGTAKTRSGGWSTRFARQGSYYKSVLLAALMVSLLRPTKATGGWRALSTQDKSLV